MAGVLLFGGSFDPIHHGHLIVARATAERIGATRVVLIPAAVSPHKIGRSSAAASHRLRMCELAIAREPLLEVCDWETMQTGPSYTLHTVNYFRSQVPRGERLYWLIGMDSLRELHTWHRIAELAALCTFVTARRNSDNLPETAALAEAIGGGLVADMLDHVVDTPRVDISSTDIRRRVAEGRSIRFLVPDAVCEYIATHHVYV